MYFHFKKKNTGERKGKRCCWGVKEIRRTGLISQVDVNDEFDDYYCLVGKI